MADTSRSESEKRLESNILRLEKASSWVDGYLDQVGPAAGTQERPRQPDFAEEADSRLDEDSEPKRSGRTHRLAECLRFAYSDFGVSQASVASSLRNQSDELVDALDRIEDGSSNAPRAGVVSFCRSAEASLSYILRLYRRNPYGPFEAVRPEKVEQLISSFREVRMAENADNSEADAERAREAARQAEQSLEAARKAAGTTADTEIGAYYSEVARAESRDARNFRALALIFFAIAVVVGWFAAREALANLQTGLDGEVLRLISVVPIVAVAIYLAHEAGGHRSVARRAREFQIRLQTLEAFTDALGDEKALKAELRAKVGASVLTGPAALDAKSGSGLNAQKVVDRLIAVLGDRESGS